MKFYQLGRVGSLLEAVIDFISEPYQKVKLTIKALFYRTTTEILARAYPNLFRKAAEKPAKSYKFNYPKFALDDSYVCFR